MAKKKDNGVERPTFLELTKKFQAYKTAVFINGMGVGKIVNVEKDCVTFEIVKNEEDDDKKKMTRETTFVPISQIATLSEGEKEVPKSEDEESIENALGDL